MHGFEKTKKKKSRAYYKTFVSCIRYELFLNSSCNLLEIAILKASTDFPEKSKISFSTIHIFMSILF